MALVRRVGRRERHVCAQGPSRPGHISEDERTRRLLRSHLVVRTVPGADISGTGLQGSVGRPRTRLRLGRGALGVVRRTEAGPEVPFQCTRTGSDPIEAALRLGGPDPLPIVAFDQVSEGDLADAWIVALAAFADLTCLDAARSISDRATEQRASQPGRTRATHPAAPLIPVVDGVAAVHRPSR
jgi:hypothetical protein